MRGFRILEIVNDADVPEDVRDAIYAAAPEPADGSDDAFFARVERLDPTEESLADASWLYGRSHASVRVGDVVENSGGAAAAGEIVTVRDGAPVRSHRFHVVGDLRVVGSDIDES